MHPMNDYFARHFITRSALARASGIPDTRLEPMIAQGLVPKPSYVVAKGSVASHVFGIMDAAGADDGEYFHRDSPVWVRRALRVCERMPAGDAGLALEREFGVKLLAALRRLDRSVWRLVDCFAQDGTPIPEGCEQRVATFREHFLAGTFGLCVARPVSEYRIALKEVLQEKLVSLTANGTRQDFSDDERRSVRELAAAYSKAAMPFSPVDYPRSSRKRLVDDMAARLAF